MYHYIESGLDNIWLGNGYDTHETPYGRGISIENTEALHIAIGMGLVNSPAELTGAEFKFLRVVLDLSQKRLADLINADEQAIRRWEKARTKPVRGSAERMIRILFDTCHGSDDHSVRLMIERLADLDATQSPPRLVYRREPNDGWQIESAQLVSA